MGDWNSGDYDGVVPPDVGGGPSGGGLGSVTLKMILSREEVEYLFGVDGNLINQLRSQSGANINLTEGDSSERVLMINGSLELIFKAFSLITRKLWDFISGLNGVLVIRLAVPASQCGSLIGKGGGKVKEIRDLSGANVQVSTESLGDSTERCVEVSGTGEAVLQCVYHVCAVLRETPLRGEIIPYVPSALPLNWKPVFLCGDRAYVIEGDVARLAPPELLRKELGKTAFGPVGAEKTVSGDSLNPLALMAAVNSQGKSSPILDRDMSVETEFIGSIIGKGGTKIAEIRRMSGATITVNEDDDGSGPTRTINLSGPEESVLLAQFLIQSTVDAAIREREAEYQTNDPLQRPSSRFKDNLGHNPHHHIQDMDNSRQRNTNQHDGGRRGYNRNYNRSSNHHRDRMGRRSPGGRNSGSRRGSSRR